MLDDKSNEGNLTYVDMIIKGYLLFLERYHKDPTRQEFTDFINFDEKAQEEGYNSWTQFFKSISAVRAQAMVDHSDEIEKLTFTEGEFGTAEYFKKAQEDIKSHKRFIISTAVNNKAVDIEFLNSLKNYAKRNDAVICWVPAHDVRSSRRVFKWNFDPALKCGYIITKDTVLNDNVMISGITASAKQIYPLTGVVRICGKVNKSIIFPGCKQMLKHVAMMKVVPTPHMATSPGAVTIPDYSEDKIMSGRTSYIAEMDHKLGAVIVELEDNKRFHLRHIQAAEDGSFTDLCVSYKPDGSITDTRNAILVNGDSHVGYHDQELLKAIFSMLRDSEVVTEVILHDIDNAASISHHERDNFIKRVIRAKNGQDSLLDEIDDVNRYLNAFTSLPNLNLTIVNSNHDRHVDRYLEGAQYFMTRDHKNAELAMELSLRLIRSEINNPVQYLSEDLATVKLEHPEKINWLKRDESYNKYGVELGMHGDEGANGGKGSLRTYETSLYNAVVGHSHSGAIHNSIFQVGTTSEMDMGYNHGLSSWTRTCCLVYEDGTKQLINFLPHDDGSYTYHA